MRKISYWQRLEGIIGPARARDFDKIGQKATRAAIELYVANISSPETILLDVGCNTGVEAIRLAAAGFAGLYVGIDSNYKAINIAEQNVSGTSSALAVADGLCLPFGAGSFDVVLCKDLLEHLFGYEQLLAELARVCRKWLLISFFIKPGLAPDRYVRDPSGFYLNRYNRERFLSRIHDWGFGNEQVLYSDNQDEVLVLERL